MKVTEVTSATATDAAGGGAWPTDPMRASKACAVTTSISADKIITRSPFCSRMAMVPGGAADSARAGGAAAARSASCRAHRRASPDRLRRAGVRMSPRAAASAGPIG
jgi:hypothetical protein